MCSQINRVVLTMAAFSCFASAVFAAPMCAQQVDDKPASSTTNTNKKTAPNPKKPADAKTASKGEGEKVKTDDRMSTRGLKPPSKDTDKDKITKPDAKPSSASDSGSPK